MNLYIQVTDSYSREFLISFLIQFKKKSWCQFQGNLLDENEHTCACTQMSRRMYGKILLPSDDWNYNIQL